MRTRGIPLAAVGALLVAAGMAALCWRASSIGEGDLRDALDSRGTFPAGEPHARLAGTPAQTCGYCHMVRSAGIVTPRWASGAEWEASPGDAPAYGSPDSSVCLSCHDGALANGSKSFADLDPSRYVPGSGMNLGESHPIGMQYLSAYAMRAGAFRHPSESPGIRLEDGRVGCISCHTIHGAREPGGRPGIIESSCESCHVR